MWMLHRSITPGRRGRGPQANPSVSRHGAAADVSLICCAHKRTIMPLLATSKARSIGTDAALAGAAILERALPP